MAGIKRTITSKDSSKTIKGSNSADEFLLKDGAVQVTVKTLKGNDKITVNGGFYHKIYAAAGKDRITLNKGNYITVYGGDGNDTVTISGGASVSDEQPPNHDPGLGTGAGNDKVTIATDAGKVVKLYTGTGDDTIYIRGGNGHEVHTGEGTDKVEVTGGNNLKIYLDDGNNELTLSNANTTTVYTGAYSVDTVTIEWTQGKQNGNYQIITPFLVSDAAPHYTDRLIVRGAKSTDFNYSYANDTLTMSNSYGSLSVDQLFTPFDFRNAFKGGITFDDRSVSVADLGKKVGVKG